MARVKTDQTTISTRVMESIRSGRTTMKPRSYFTLLSFVALSASVVGGFLLAYVMSIIFYWLRIQAATTPAWGARARLDEAIAGFPWWAVLIVLGLGIMCVILLRKVGRLYRFRAKTVGLLLVLLAVIIGVIFSYLQPLQPKGGPFNGSQQGEGPRRGRTGRAE